MGRAARKPWSWFRNTRRCAAGMLVLTLAACGQLPPDARLESAADDDALHGGVRPCRQGAQSSCCGDGICAGRETRESCSRDCATPNDLCAGVDCGGHGHCLIESSSPRCVCDSGYREQASTCVAEPGDEAVDCSAIASVAGWQLCAATATTCAAVFADGAGCPAVCAALGLSCQAVYENAAGSCAPDQSLPALSCATPSGHQSDYCLCGGPCLPSCDGRECGDDGCGGACGTCVSGTSCAEGSCRSSAAEAWCGDGTCAGDETCSSCAVDCGTCPPPPPSTCPAGSRPVFPSAMGFGSCTPAGRGGQVLRVTNLNDAGPGSLRAAVTATGARVVVFEVAGQIDLAASLVVSSPFVTVAGQTAPSPGILLRGAGVVINTHDVLIQHLAVRPGAAMVGEPDGLHVYGSAQYNVVLDHISVSWAVDEQVAFAVGAHDITISNSLVAEALGEGHGMFIGSGASRISVVRNLLAHNGERNPTLKGGTSAAMINNLVYNASGNASYLSDNYNEGPIAATYVGNSFLIGPDSVAGYEAIAIVNNIPDNSRVFQTGNFYDNGAAPVLGNYDSPSVVVSVSPIDLAPYAIDSDLAASRTRVLAQAGARPADRDAVDRRIVAEVTAKSGQQPAAAPVYPSAISATRVFAAPADPDGDSDGDGYTNLEELLHQLAAAVER